MGDDGRIVSDTVQCKRDRLLGKALCGRFLFEPFEPAVKIIPLALRGNPGANPQYNAYHPDNRVGERLFNAYHEHLPDLELLGSGAIAA